ncbi:MAG: carboxypeptidase-like regulatory domain-containing protein, partial [Mucilaginibacter polytrichastri]|nr:carboxypeptidase-like regulatory domain-containing protein [Mucilaginibacter polytrichastri]
MPFSLSKICAGICAMFLFSQHVFAQADYRKTEKAIDSLAAIGLPKSALRKVDELDALARKNGDAARQIKAAVYRMNFQSYMEEDAFEAIITRLKMDSEKASFPVKPVLQSILAESYHKYYEQNRYRIYQRSQTTDTAGNDFKSWDTKALLTETGRLYAASIGDADRLRNTPVDILDGALQGDTATRYLRPTLYDLLAQRALNFYLANETEIAKPRQPFSLNQAAFFADGQTFAALDIHTADSTSGWFRGLKLLQQLSLFHRQKNHTEAAADLDRQRLQFVYRESTLPGKDSLYLSALRAINRQFASTSVSSEALYLEGEFWRTKDSLRTAVSLFEQAIANYPRSLAAENARIMLADIKEQSLNVSMESAYPSDQPHLVLLNYRNVRSVRSSVYFLDADQKRSYDEMFRNELSVKGKMPPAWVDQFRNMKPVQSYTIDLPDPGDYRPHSTETALNRLKTGDYVLVNRDAVSKDSTLMSVTAFTVSDLAYVLRKNPEGQTEFITLHRKTGAPLSGVQVALATKYHTDRNSSRDSSIKGITNAAGRLVLGKFSESNLVSVSLKKGGDHFNDEKYITRAYDPDYRDDGDKTLLFTDRHIYRPGQTLYFKGLQLAVTDQKSRIVKDHPVEITISSNNGDELFQQTFRTNAFGSFSGSFVIPQNGINGELTLETDDDELRVQVEEYKRPTFVVEFLPVKKAYKLNDSVELKGNVRAFSGYGLSNARVAYRITRSEMQHYVLNYGNEMIYGPRLFPGHTTDFQTDTLVADRQGNFTIRFKAMPDEKDLKMSQNYAFSITADVTGESDETQHGSASVTIGRQNTSIADNLPETVLATDTLTAAVRLFTLNGEMQKGDINIEICALDTVPLFKTRLWNVPDQFALSKTDFKKNFPDYAYPGDELFSHRKILRRITSFPIKVSERGTGDLKLDLLRRQEPGLYRISMRARNAGGDTVSSTKYIQVIAEGARTGKMNDWIVPVKTTIKPGESALFYAGINTPSQVLMERFDGKNKLSSEWITLNGNRRIYVPFPVDSKTPAVQFLMVSSNRVYSTYTSVAKERPADSLQLKFLTFRNKLEPGQKERWTLQLTAPGNAKTEAELMAGMYDASLDNILQPQNGWRSPGIFNGLRANILTWQTVDFLIQTQSMPVVYRQAGFSLRYRDYEQLDMLGYAYYGGYNAGYRTFLAKINLREERLKADRQAAEASRKQIESVKIGYEISGYVRSASDGHGLGGVRIQIAGSSTAITSDSKGFFRIKAPVNTSLSFTCVGYQRKTITIKSAAKINVRLTEDATSLNEVVVTGHGTQSRRDLTGAVATITMRGYNSLAGRTAGASVMQAVAFPPPAIHPAIIPRRNFAETAFFYPQLKTDEKGQILLEFTMPDALTRWKFRALAHTQDFRTAYLEEEILTQKQLSVTANMPRFLREGDTLTVSARMANLSDKKLIGNVSLELFNAVTMQPVPVLLSANESRQKFSLNAASTGAVRFRLAVPAGLDALTYRLTASAGQFSDGEENTIPVLPNRILVTESMPVLVRAGQQRDFTFDKLKTYTSTTLRNKSLTLEYTQNPAWYAAQALPYLMEFPYECSEQTFSRYFANALGTELVNSIPAIRQVFDRWKSSAPEELMSNLEKNQELKSVLLEETPWLREAGSEAEQKKRVALLFELNTMQNNLRGDLEKLQQKQLGDGGFPWFGGETTDRFITQHILAGIGQLSRIRPGDAQAKPLDNIADRALIYMDKQLM